MLIEVMTTQDLLLIVAQRAQTRTGLCGRWTLFDDAWHESNVLIVSCALSEGLVVCDGGRGLRLTRAGRQRLALPRFNKHIPIDHFTCSRCRRVFHEVQGYTCDGIAYCDSCDPLDQGITL